MPTTTATPTSMEPTETMQDVRVLTGDVHASLLRPHQLLLSSADANRLAIPSFTLVRLQKTHQKSTISRCLLEVIVDRRAPQQGGLSDGFVQVHPWVLDALSLFDGEVASFSKEALSLDTRHRVLRKLTLAVVTRSPLRTTHSSSTAAAASSSTNGSVAATASILPDSVRSGLVDITSAVQRQLTMMYSHHDSLTIASGDLVPLQFMGETFVFRVDDARYEESEALIDGESEKPPPFDVHVLGLSTRPTSNTTVESLSSSLNDLQLSEDSDHALKTRLDGLGFAGYSAFVQDALFHVLLNFLPKTSGFSATIPSSLACHGLLLHGVQGIGKSLAIQVLDNELQRRGVATWRVDAMSLLMDFENSKVASAYEFLITRFQQCIPLFGRQSRSSQEAAGVVLIDDIDVLFQPTNGQDAGDSTGSDDQSGLMLMPLGSALLRLLSSMDNRTTGKSQRLCVVGTTTMGASGAGAGEDSGDDRIPAIAKRSGRFDKSIEMIVPTEAMRRDILTLHLKDLPLEQSASSPEDESMGPKSLATRLAALTGGYVAKDLVRICRSAYIQARTGQQISSKGLVSWELLLQAQRQIKPSQLQQLNVASPSTDADGSVASPFAGYEKLRKQLCDFIEWKFHPSEAMKHLGVANASGLLIHGPSGCGKSLLVKTLAAQAQVNFVSVKSSELLSKYFGDSERAVRQLFARARAASPCLLFFDEFDSIAHKRSFGDGNDGGDGSGVYARILSTFLNEMDGVGAARDRVADVLVVAATNRVDALDAALIRPGRIDKSVELALPDREDRLAILQHYTCRMPLAEDLDLAALADRPTGKRTFTGADIAAVCKEAAFRSLRQDMDATVVRAEHFVAAWDQRAAL